MITDDTLFASVSELAAQIRARRLSPVELAEGYLRRLETVGKRLNAVAFVMRDTAMREARQAEAEIKRGRYRGPLHGIPYGVKDLIATRGTPTTWGATPYKDQRFDYDATVVTRLREAGAVLLGKLAMIELAGRVPHALEPRLLVGRLIFGAGRGNRFGVRRLRHRLGDFGFNHHAVRLLRPVGSAPDLRRGLAPRRDGPLLDARQARPHVPLRARLRPRPLSHRG